MEETEQVRNENGNNRNDKGRFVAGNTASVGKGRPKGSKSIPDILKKIAEEPGTKDGQLSKLEVVLRQVFQFALEGRAWAVEFIAERTEGKVKQGLEVGIMPEVVFTPIEQTTEEEWNKQIIEMSEDSSLLSPNEIN